jgi:hypothetical protein
MACKRARRGKRFLVAVTQSAADQGIELAVVPLWYHRDQLRSGWASAMYWTYHQRFPYWHKQSRLEHLDQSRDTLQVFRVGPKQEHKYPQVQQIPKPSNLERVYVDTTCVGDGFSSKLLAGFE